MQQLLDRMNKRGPATDAAVGESEREVGLTLPSEYQKFLHITNGGEGFVGESEYVIFWSVAELARMNEAYQIQTYVPGLLVFGSNGGGETYGFDTRVADWPIVKVPFVGMEWELAIPMGASFGSFLEQLYRIKSMDHSGGQLAQGLSGSRGMEIFEIQPVILGGSPTDLKNKMVLNREDHIKYVVFWNKFMAKLRGREGAAI